MRSKLVSDRLRSRIHQITESVFDGLNFIVRQGPLILLGLVILFGVSIILEIVLSPEFQWR